MQNTTSTTNGNDFIDKIKAIPILDICQALGIEFVERGGKYWCKLRIERTASAILNVHKEPNTFIDFGGENKERDVIQFVAEALNTDRSDAVKYLANTFNIKHERQNGYSNDLENWEYQKIGLYGDMATKNFTFDIERQGIERVAELSQKYGMPMKDLRKKHPKIYEQLLRDKAIPYVQAMRNDYYLSLINTYHMVNVTDLSAFSTVHADLEKAIDALRNAERLLQKAAAQTSLKAFSVGEYSPESDLKKILAGELKPAIGNHNYKQIQAAAKDRNCSVKYRTVPWDKFSFKGLEDYPFSAFFKGDSIVIGYLECDHMALKPYLDKMSGKERLGDKIAEAEKKRLSNPLPIDKQVQHQAER